MDIIIMILLIFQLLRKWSLNIEDKRTRQSISKWGLLKTRKVLNFKSVAVYMSIMLAHHILRILFFHIKNIKAKNNKILEEKFMISLLQCLRSMQIWWILCTLYKGLHLILLTCYCTPLHPPQQAGQEDEISLCFIFAKQATVHIVEIQT